jgi:hypothetical protein
MYSEDRFDIGTGVICIRDYKKLKSGSHYHISGMGNLSLVNSDKSGFGFSIVYSEYDFRSRKSNHEFYYFSLDEMSEYFITEDEDYKSKIRDEKINQIILKTK